MAMEDNLENDKPRYIKKSYNHFTENRRMTLLKRFREKTNAELNKGQREIEEDLADEFNADTRTIQRNIKTAQVEESKRKTDDSTLIRIGSLQALARWGRDAVRRVPRAIKARELDAEFVNLLLVAQTLVNDVRWVELAGYIGAYAADIQALEQELGGAPLRALSLDERIKRTENARHTIEAALLPMLLSSDTKEWVKCIDYRNSLDPSA
jgi:hypothetical protein